MKWLSLLSSLLAATLCAVSAQPNIVLVITDDQGYGDIAAHGNPVIKTPHMDALAAESVVLEDYHVAPTCSPTRAALLTGHWSNRTGVWHTVNGRSMLRADEVTLGQMLRQAGYETGMFGKWHLGDNYPFRPEDRGFSEVYRHGGGGVGQTPDVWDNAYFDGAYFHNGEITPAEGFCTDVFFEQGKAFIRRCAAEEKPFFAYISTNAPHGPLHCPPKYLEMYKDQNPGVAAFFGMITNIDDQVGATRALLDELGETENTIFIFTTDNGTASGERIFNAGMRGKKGSAYEGGHRVPFFLHWPGGDMGSRREVSALTHAVDVVPTLLDLAEVPAPPSNPFDGLSLKPLLTGQATGDSAPWSDRFLVTDSQRVRDPIKWKASSVMSGPYRLINGEELYHVGDDPGQERDVAEEHPERVQAMRAFYDRWWAELEPTFEKSAEAILGHEDHPRVILTGHDWIQEDLPPWNQRHIRQAHGLTPRKRAADSNTTRHQGHWAVRVAREGSYRIVLRRWPFEAQQPIRAALPAGEDVPGASKAFRAVPGQTVEATRATLRIDGEDRGSAEVGPEDLEVVFEVTLTEGSHRLAPVFHTEEGELGAYYAMVTPGEEAGSE